MTQKLNTIIKEGTIIVNILFKHTATYQKIYNEACKSPVVTQSAPICNKQLIDIHTHAPNVWPKDTNI